MDELDKKVLEFLDLLVEFKIIKYKTQFYRQIDFHISNTNNIKKGFTHFTLKQIYGLKFYNINYNWVFGNEKNQFIDNKLPKANYHNVLYHINSKVTT